VSGPLVSVIVPMFNSAPTVGRTVRSVAEQSLSRWELIVVDDGSTDGGAGARAVLDAARGDPRARIITQANRGLAGARNAGLSHARGRWICFLDADDWLLPPALERLVRTAADAGTPGAVGSAIVCDNDERPLFTHAPAPGAPGTVGGDDLLDRVFFPPNAHVLDRSVLQRAGAERGGPGGCFDESLRVVEDLELWTRLADAGVRWAIAPTEVCGYRVRPGSLSKQGSLMLAATLAVRGAAFDRAIDRAPPDRRAGLLVRRQAALRRSTLDIAARSALLGDAGRTGEAVAMVLERLAALTREGPWTIAPADAGAAGAAAWLWGLGARPDGRDPEHGRRQSALDALWSGLARAGLAGDGPDRDALPAAARAHQARALLDPSAVVREVARTVMDRLATTGGRGPVTLVGAGRNGLALAAELLSLGVAAELRDDRAGIAVPVGCALGPLSAALPERGPVVITPADGAALAARLASGGVDPARVVVWSAVADTLCRPYFPASISPTRETIAGTTPS
jgi:hypothetical protein